MFEKEEEQEETKADIDKISKYIAEEETDINEELFETHFNFQRPSDIFNSLNNTDDIENNNKLVDVIIIGLKHLKKEIKKIPEEEKKMKGQVR